jgi:formate hydrogenlyase transcriptional activator
MASSKTAMPSEPLVSTTPAAADEHETLLREARDTADRLRLILDINNTIVANLELQDLLHAVAASLRRALQCDAAAISVADTEAGSLRYHAVDFPESIGVARPGYAMPIEGTLLGEVFRTAKPTLHSLADGIGGDEVAGPEGIRFGCVVPLFSKDKTIGVLSVGRRDAPAFTERDLELLVQVSTQVAIALDNSMAWGQINELKSQLAREKVYLEDEIRSEMHFREIVGKTKALREILQQVEVVAPTDSTVLIYGETGTGKEAIARAIHDLSARKTKAFVKLNCAALPTGLMESELFGHEKGAFTGAISQRIGRFELANGGSVFLDEIGEIPLEVQPKLLRVLQEREFERLGGSKTFRTDARLIAATNRDLEAMVSEQKFRSDLYYRLNVFPIRVPPLRERADDIPQLVRHFVQQFGRRMGKTIETIPSETMEALVRYHWPGNVRELQNVVERAVILTRGSVLNVAVGELARRSAQPPASNSRARKDMQSVLDETERQHIIRALEETNWVIAGPNGAAARLGMKRSTLHARMQKLGVQITRSGPSQ